MDTAVNQTTIEDMTMNTHTAGPWYHTLTKGEQRIQRADIDGVTDICTVHQLDYAGADHTEQYSNCSLIAAAPETLAALHTATAERDKERSDNNKLRAFVGMVARLATARSDDAQDAIDAINILKGRAVQTMQDIGASHG
jgi:hypothetical protein